MGSDENFKVPNLSTISCLHLFQLCVRVRGGWGGGGETFRSLSLLTLCLKHSPSLCVVQEERAYSEAQSSLVNKSYQTLLKTLPRGLYLLELHGASMEEDEVHLDPAFLMEIMEVNELLAEVDDIDALRKIGRENHQILTQLMSQVAEAFADGDIEKAKECLARLKYYINIDDKVQDFMSRFGGQD